MSLDVPFRITSDVRPQAATVAVGGEIDLSNATELRSILDELVAATDGDIIIDLSEVTYLDSCGLHELIDAQSRLAAQGRRFVVQRPSPIVLRLFEISDLTKRFSMNADGDGANTSRLAGAHESRAEIDS